MHQCPEPGHSPLTRVIHQLHRALLAGLEAHCRPRRDTQPHAQRSVAVEPERGAGFREMTVQAHLHRSIAGAAHNQRQRPAASVEGMLAAIGEDFARNHLWTITWSDKTSKQARSQQRDTRARNAW